MKRIISAVIALIFLFVFVISAFSVDIDGIDGGIEWENATAYKLTEGESNCGVEFGLVKVKFDAKNSAVFLCFMFIDPLLEQGNLSAGISVSIENSEEFVMNMATSPQNVDIDKYNIEGAMSIDENNGATCEVRVGIKAGLPKIINGTVRFIDAFGEPSNIYAFALVNEEYSETTVKVISPTADNDNPVYNPGLLTQKATKEQTVKRDTTRKKRTTTTKPERTRWELEDSPYTYTGRAKQEKKEDAATQTIIVPAVTVYYYEKEVIISHVYINEPNASVNAAEEEPVSAVLTSSKTEDQLEEKTERFSITDGSRYKLFSVLGGGAAFAVIAVLGAAGAKHKSVKDSGE